MPLVPTQTTTPFEPPPTSPPSPSFDSLLLLALVERFPPLQPIPSLQILHSASPHHSPSSPTLTAARDALLAAAPFVFPTQSPNTPPQPPHLHIPSDNHHHHHHHTQPSSAPPLKLTPTARTSPPPSPIPTPTPTTHLAPHPHPHPHHTAQLDRAVDLARTLPLSSLAVYDALAEPSSESRLKCSPQQHPRKSDPEASPRRANSLPKRPTSSPPPRLRSLGLPGYSGADLPVRTESNTHLTNDPQAQQEKRRDFRQRLLAAKTHVFAITSRDGTRQYAYCRPLSATHALVVLTHVSHTGVYTSALEHTAARYTLLLDEASAASDVGEGSSGPRRFLRSQLMRCPPEVAKLLVSSLFDWLKAGTHRGGQAEKSHGLLKRTRSRFFRENPDLDGDDATDGDPNATFLTSSTTSSGLSSGPRDGFSARRSTTGVQEVFQERDLSRFFQRKDSASSSNNGQDLADATALPWEAAANSVTVCEPSVITRVLELSDATLLFRHFPVRGILSVIVALLEERRVCVVGQSTSAVSRAVIAFDNLLRPFEWPHLLAPILLDHMLPVLGAPFPFLVGIHADQFEKTAELPLDEVIFADIGNGKVTSTLAETGDLHRHVHRKLRSRFERRLTRAKNACMRQVNRAASSPSVPNVSNTASSYFQESLCDSGDRPRSSSLFRSKSQLRLQGEAHVQNVWLEYETVITLDRGIRKFFAELLEDLPSMQEDVAAQKSLPKPETGGKGINSSVHAVSLASLRRDADRQQLMKAFCETQMFMQWKGLDKADITFGIVRAEGTQLRKRSSLRDKKAFAKKLTDGHADPKNDAANVHDHDATDFECHEDITDDFLSGMDEIAALSRYRSKKKTRRSIRARIQFNSDVEELGAQNHQMQSEMESSFWSKGYFFDRNPRHHNTSTDCIPDTEAYTDAELPLKEMEVPAAKSRHRRHQTWDFFPDGDPKSLSEELRQGPKLWHRNPTRSYAAGVEPQILAWGSKRPASKHHRRTASTDCVSGVEGGSLMEEGGFPFVKENHHRRIASTDCVPDSDSEEIRKKPRQNVRRGTYRWNVRDFSSFTPKREPDDSSPDYASDRLDDDLTEVEGFDDESDEEGGGSETDIFPSDGLVLSKSRARMWGRRRIRRSIRVY